MNSSSDSEDSDDGGGDIDEYERRPRSTATDTETGLDDYGFHSEEVDLDLHGSVVVGEDEDPSLPSTSTSTSASTSTTPRPRGRPKNVDRPAQPPRPVVREPDWEEVGAGTETMNNFRFAPPNGSGVIAPLTPVSSALQCLETLLKQSILEELRDNINEYAEMLCRKNNPPTKR